jgi:hypothetical protein
MKLGEADIHTVEIGDEVTQDKEGYQPPHHLSDYPLFYIFHGEASSFGLSALTSFCRFQICGAEERQRHFKSQNESGSTPRRSAAFLRGLQTMRASQQSNDQTICSLIAWSMPDEDNKYGALRQFLSCALLVQRIAVGPICGAGLTGPRAMRLGRL